MRDGRISQTALRIARILLFFAEDPRYEALLPPDLIQTSRQLLIGAGLHRRWHQVLYRSRPYGGLVRLADRVVRRGALVHFPLRKRFVEDEVRAARAAGAGQLLVIGAGLDTLAIRLASEDPTLLAVEVDHPATGEAKARGVSQAGLGSDNLRLVPLDLAAHPLAAALQATQWRRCCSVIVAEGLLMYLPIEAVRALLTALHEQTGPGSRVVFTWLPVVDGELKLDRVIRAGISLLGEPVRFSMEPRALGPFLAELGWRLLPDVDLRARYLEGGPLAAEPITEMERFSVAERV